jgi:two-component system sensor histidine kinase HydH
VVGIDPDGQIAFVSPSACTLLGIGPARPADLNGLPPALRNLVLGVQGKTGDGHPQVISIASDGMGDRWVTVDLAPMNLPNAAQGLLLTVSGLQRGNAFETRIRHLERLARLGLLSAGLAHELRNAMVALSTMTDLLLEQQGENELAQMVRRELDRANQLAIRMLRYARPSVQARRPTSTHAILERALHLANSRLKEAGTTVTRSLRADPDVVSGDEAHLEQMFLNLLLNAADAVHPSGEVMLSTALVEEPSLGRAVQIAVRDTGPGITPEALANLFQPFFTTKRHGTGLGLYLAHRIIDEHAGTIRVSSNPGEGTCVFVNLPAYAA